MDTKHRDTAVALHYNGSDERAPTVTAKGFGLVAERIRELAEKSGVPIRRDSDLVALLAEIDVDREIPPELYAAVAEVLAMVYRANGEMGGMPEAEGRGP